MPSPEFHAPDAPELIYDCETTVDQDEVVALAREVLRAR